MAHPGAMRKTLRKTVLMTVLMTVRNTRRAGSGQGYPSEPLDCRSRGLSDARGDD